MTEPNRSAEIAPADHDSVVLTITTTLPPYPANWDRAVDESFQKSFGRSKPTKNVTDFLSDRKLQLEQAVSGGWSLRSTITLTDPNGGAITILDTLVKEAPAGEH